jgi:hypothetical protein
VIAAAFGFALPHFASYHSVWASLQAMTWVYVVLVGVTATASLASYWFGICAVLPSLRLREAAVVNLSSNAVANALPAAGALGMGVSWAMLSGWGVSTADYVLYTAPIAAKGAIIHLRRFVGSSAMTAAGTNTGSNTKAISR